MVRRHIPLRNPFRDFRLDTLDHHDPLLQLGRSILWMQNEADFRPLYPKTGHPANLIRLKAGRLMIKLFEVMRDEKLIKAWAQNLHWQQFCGELILQNTTPCAPFDLTYFHDRNGPDGAQRIVADSAMLLGADQACATVLQDTTC